MAVEIVAGDSRLYTVDLFRPGATSPETFIINPGADAVTVALVSVDRKTRFTTPLTVLSTLAGADWTKSKIAFKFPRDALANLRFAPTIKGEIPALLEVQVTFNSVSSPDDWTWFISGITLVKGQIP